MKRFIRTTTLSATLLGMGLAPSWSLAGSPYSANRQATAEPAGGTSGAAVRAEKPVPKVEEQVVIIRESGKPDRHCVLVTLKTMADGSRTYVVKANDTGELLTIDQKGNVEPDQGPPIKSADELKLVESFDPPKQPKPSAEAPIASPAASVAVESVSPESNLPRLKERAVDPLLNPPSIDSIRTPVSSKPKHVEPKPPRKGFIQSFFSMDLQSGCDSTCGVCESVVTAPVPLIAQTAEPLPVKGMAMIEPPGRSIVADPAPAMIAEPLMVTAGMNLADKGDPDWKKLAELRETLVHGLRPTQRMAAAEDMIAIAPGRLQEVRAALMTAAQEDPAGCVRAACVHCLSKLRTRDQAYINLLDVAQEDEDAEVRDVVAYAMQKVAKK